MTDAPQHAGPIKKSATKSVAKPGPKTARAAKHAAVERAAVERVPSAGQPIDRGLRQNAEATFGHDFSRVRIHADGDDARRAGHIGARAFTSGADIFFGAGEFVPFTSTGARLLAHELAHVVQGERGAPPSPGIAPPHSAAESQARRWADQAMLGRAGPATGEAAAEPHRVMREGKTAAEPATMPAESKPAAVEPDYAWLAFEVYDAMEGLGTDEERVYRALEQLRKDPDRIAKFREAYKKYGDLTADLIDDFSENELEYALQLLNQRTPEGPLQVVAGKASPADFPELVQRLHHAFFDSPGTDEEEAYAQLVRLDHDPDLIAAFETFYRKASDGQDLRATIADEMEGEEYHHAMYLISVPYEHWLRRANDQLRGIKFGIPWGSFCGPEGKDSQYPNAYDDRYWMEVDDVRNGNIVGCKLTLKSGVRPSTAVTALIEEQGRWAVDCAGFVQMTHWYAMIKVAGPDRFDAAVTRPFDLKKSQSTGVRTVKTYKAHAPGESMEVHVPQNGELVEDTTAKHVDVEDALKSAPVGSRVMWTNNVFAKRQKFGPNIDAARAFENENSLKLGPDQYGAFPLHSGARKVMARAEIEQLMAASAVNVYPELSVPDMLKYVYISEIEFIDPALTGPEGAPPAKG